MCPLSQHGCCYLAFHPYRAALPSTTAQAMQYCQAHAMLLAEAGRCWSSTCLLPAH